jgi:uncharacterized protein
MSAQTPVRLDVVDAVVHPMVRRSDELREYMEEPWRSRVFPPPHRYLYPAPTGIPPYGEYREDTRSGGGLPGSNPDLVAAHLAACGADAAILLPLTRGLLPDTEMNTVICAATNDWLAATWLGQWNAAGRYFGSIRVNPEDAEGAVREIERWAGHPRMIQVAIPLESHQPYGQRRYFKVWEAAARHRLPIAVHTDGGAGVDFKPTAIGYPLHYIEYSVMYPFNFIYHLASFVAEGVFRRLPDVKVVFADGGHDLLMPLMWRMDMDWLYSRPETPWVTQMPSEYLRPHVRFCTSRFEAPGDPSMSTGWIEMTDASELLLFASNYPHWSTMSPADLPDAGSSDAGRRVLGENARDWYNLDRART